MAKQKTICEDYVPRHLRVGAPSCMFSTAVAQIEVSKEIPILDNHGNVIGNESAVEIVPIHDLLKDVRVEDFKMSNLQRAGVPLTEVNFDLMSRSRHEELIQKALQLGVLADSMPIVNELPTSVDNPSVNPSVEPSKE